MIPEVGSLALLPPLTAIALSLLTRQVHLSLFTGVWLGTTLLHANNPVRGAAGALEQLVAVLNDPAGAKVLLFSLMVGALIALTRDSGGVAGFADWMVERGWVRGPRSAQVISALLGVSIFIESSITCLIAGAVSRPLYDRVGVSRAKLAYICDSTSAPICTLIPLNAWGALLLGLLAAQGVDEPLRVLIAALPLNFYAVLALTIVFTVALTGWELGPMRVAEAVARARGSETDLPDAEAVPLASESALALGKQRRSRPEPATPGRARNLVVPVLATVLMMPLGLVLTGDGDWTRGSGETAVLWSVGTGIFVAMLTYRLQGLFNLTELIEKVLKGFEELVGVVAILALAGICRQLGTGPFVAEQVAPWIGSLTLAPLVFLTGCLISFATGSSWGTFAILMPIAIPVAIQLGAPLALTTAAVMGGGIFGDHCSPISDTTVISSLSAGCDHIEHVTTQMPYALVAGAGAVVLYIFAGLVGG